MTRMSDWWGFHTSCMGGTGGCELQGCETLMGWVSAAGFVLGEASAEQRPGYLLGCSDGW